MRRSSKVFLIVCGWIVMAGTALAQDTNPASGILTRPAFFGEDERLTQAIQDLNQTIQREPTNAVALFKLAELYQVTRQFDRAISLWTTCVRLNPTNAAAYKFRAVDYSVLGKYDAAIEDFTRELDLIPNDAYSVFGRGCAFNFKGDYDRAAHDFTTTCQIDPTNEAACNNLAWLRATCPVASLRDGTEAVSLALKACDLTQWQDWTRIDTLAAAYAEAGDFSSAMHYEKMALQMDGISSAIQRKLQDRVTLYQQHQPYREAMLAK